jgi:hypothetical protein
VLQSRRELLIPIQNCPPGNQYQATAAVTDPLSLGVTHRTETYIHVFTNYVD